MHINKKRINTRNCKQYSGYRDTVVQYNLNAMHTKIKLHRLTERTNVPVRTQTYNILFNSDTALNKAMH